MSSCNDAGHSSSNAPKYLIPEDSLIDVLLDIHMSDAAAKQNLLPNNTNTYHQYQQYKAILEHHGISKTRFDSTLFYYSGQGQDFEEIYEKVVKKLSEQLEKAKEE